VSSIVHEQPEDLLLSYNHLKGLNRVKSQLKEWIWGRINCFLVLCLWFCRLSYSCIVCWAVCI